MIRLIIDCNDSNQQSKKSQEEKYRQTTLNKLAPLDTTTFNDEERFVNTEDMVDGQNFAEVRMKYYKYTVERFLNDQYVYFLRI